MKNSKYQLLTVIVLLLIIGSVLMCNILDGTSSEKLSVFRYSATSFSTAVSVNMDAFENAGVVYLDEVIDKDLMDSIKSPFSSNNCDINESKVEFDSGNKYVTLKCDDYLIDHVSSGEINNTAIYEVGKWSEDTSSKTSQNRKLYNCSRDGKLIFDQYYEEDYFVYKLNTLNNTDYVSINDIDSKDCNVVSKTFHRTKKEIKN